MNEHQNQSAAGRGWSLGKLGLQLTSSYVGQQLAELFLSGAAKDESRRKFRQKSFRHVREELQSLKGPVMKMGQVLSMQDNVLPPELVEELSKLQMQAPGMHPTMARAQFKASCGKIPEDVFREFSAKPFAAASLGQVHRAITKKGEAVVVKIQYPAMQTAIKNDFKLLRSVSLTGHIPKSVIDELENGILVETDYQNEASNIEFFHKSLKPLEYVQVPKVYWDYTTDRVLTMSYIEGAPMDQFLTQKPSQASRNQLGRRLLELFLYQIYHVRAVHADPHPGNYLITSDGRISLVDFGCVKKFSPEFAELVSCFLNRAWLKGDKEFDRMMRLMWTAKVSITNEQARAILRTEIGLVEMVFPPIKSGKRPVSFSGTELFDVGVRRNVDVVLAKLAQPEFPFYERAEMGLYTYLRQLGADLDTNEILASTLARRD